MFYIFLADGFEEIEALCPYDLILRAGIPVKTVSINETTLVTGTHGIKMHADITLAEMEEDFDGIMLPGGLPGADNLNACEKVQACLKKASSEGKLISAICAAPYVLGQAGLLEGKKATCFPGFEDRMTGAVHCTDKVVTDANIITAKGMGAAFEFGIEIIKYYKGQAFAEEIAAKTQN
ncbi:MAG: DJ-1/PfpI family protein [Clostridia bacterium]|nr:DJ-1/PfpI family protein [Clostridia bacterium]